MFCIVWRYSTGVVCSYNPKIANIHWIWLCRTPYLWLICPVFQSPLRVLCERALWDSFNNTSDSFNNTSFSICHLLLLLAWGFLRHIYCNYAVKEEILFPSIIAVWVLLIFLYVRKKKSHSSVVDFWIREQRTWYYFHLCHWFATWLLASYCLHCFYLF